MNPSWSPDVAGLSFRRVPGPRSYPDRGTDVAAVGVLLSLSQMLFEHLKDSDGVLFTVLLVPGRLGNAQVVLGWYVLASLHPLTRSGEPFTELAPAGSSAPRLLTEAAGRRAPREEVVNEIPATATEQRWEGPRPRLKV